MFIGRWAFFLGHHYHKWYRTNRQIDDKIKHVPNFKVMHNPLMTVTGFFGSKQNLFKAADMASLFVSTWKTRT